MQGKRQPGFTLIEVMVALAVIGVLALVAVSLMRDGLANMRARGGVRAMADLLMLARTEAVRTGDNHLVFFEMDAEDNALWGPEGQAAIAVVVRDADDDGRIDSGEVVASIGPDQTGSLSWGSTFAAAGSSRAPNDNPDATFPETDLDFLCCTFVEPDGDPARWVLFRPDGMPRAFELGPFTSGPLASGNGSVYVTSGERDWAVVLAPLGGIRWHGWVRGANAWTD